MERKADPRYNFFKPNGLDGSSFCGGISCCPLIAFSNRPVSPYGSGASVGRPLPQVPPGPLFQKAIRSHQGQAPTIESAFDLETAAFTIYDASAGSGKTHTLVKEYLKIVLRSPKNDAYRNILAITFTNKAVHEMKSRIVDTLFEFTKDQPSAKALQMLAQLLEETKIPEPALREKARLVIRHLIHNYAAFDISTIDKFTHRVIRAFARDLNLSSAFEVSLDTDSLLAEAVDGIIARAGEDPVLTNLLVDFTLEKTDSDKSWDVSREIFETGKLALNENHRSELDHFQDKSISDFLEVKKHLGQLTHGITQSAVSLAREALSLIDQHQIEQKSFYSGYIPKHFQKIASGELMVHEGHLKYLREEDKKRYASSVSAAQKSAIDTVSPRLLEILLEINRLAARQIIYDTFLRHITPLSLLNTITAELARIQLEQNILPISEFNSIIHREIQNQPAPFIYERLGERYRHFFIDEFQDTSEMQWENLLPLINNALSGQDEQGSKGTLMIVGDPKQSIYRWRGGKVEQFIDLAKKKSPFSNPEKDHISLETNWRSYPEVIAFNNDFFHFLSDRFENVDYQELYRDRSRQLSAKNQGGYVNISFAQDTEDGTDKFALATLDRINELKRKGFSYAEITILTRKKQQGIALARHLNENGIPIISSESLQLEASDKVQFLLHFLKYLHNRKDRESKARWLYFVALFHGIQESRADFISQGLVFQNDVQLGAWLSALGIDLDFETLRKKALYETVERIASAVLPETDAYVQYFLDLVLEREVRYQSGLGSFLEYWQLQGEKFSIPSPEGKDAVRIMTIHKAKGLEFPVVIFPYAEEDFSNRPREKVWVPNHDQEIALPRMLTELSEKMNQLGDQAREIYQSKKQEELLDIVNVLYVALTRAEEQLHVISAMNFTSKGELKENNLSAFFIEFLMRKGVFDQNIHSYDFGKGDKLSEVAEKPSVQAFIKPVMQVMQLDQVKIARKEALMWGSDQSRAIDFGNTVHEVLSRVGLADELDGVLDAAETEGLITASVRGEIHGWASEILHHPELSFFFSDGFTHYREQAIISPETGTLKPDRITIDQDKNAWLLDYKTGTHNRKYEQQLEAYALALEEMGYSVRKKMLVYTGSPVKVIAL